MALAPFEPPFQKWPLGGFTGLIDSDGYFYINKNIEISFELTTHISDARIVYKIKNQLKAASVKLRNPVQSIRYRVKYHHCKHCESYK